MELVKNLRWICRVCTVNIKKRRSTQSAVSIFDTPQLCEKLTKYLYIEIDPGDELPKKICGNCYKRIESFHSFASLANKTENFLKDFINITKGNVGGTDSFESLNNKFQGEFASFALLTAEKSGEVIMNDLAVNDAGELILNVSVNDPLIKDMANKIDLATKRRTLEFERHKTQNEVTKVQNKSKSFPGDFYKLSNYENLVNNEDQLTQQQRITSCGNFSSNFLSENRKIQQQEEMFNRSSMTTYDCLNLGSVIKDMDLLKLILKALKWPYTRNSLSAQIQKLKSTRLRDVITDPNLLQDTDMTQILRSYLSPVILQSHNNNAPYKNTSTSTALNSLSSIVPYRIPADTSVQLISVPSTEAKSDYYSDCHHNQNVMTTKRKSPLPIVLSDDSNDNDVQLFEVSVDPRLYFPGEKEFFFHQYNNTESPTENSTTNTTALRAENSKSKVRKKHKRKEGHKNDSNREKITSEQQDIGTDENPRDIISVHHNTSQDQRTNTKSIVIQDNEGFKDFDIDSITLIEEASGDDEIWAEFKVTESPDNSEIDDHHDEINIKKEAVGEVETYQNIKPVDEKPYMTLSANKRKTRMEVIKEELSSKPVEEKSNSNTNTTHTSVKKELNRKTSRKKCVRSNIHLKEACERITREKNPRTYFNKRKQKNKKSEDSRSQVSAKKQKVVEKESVQSSRKSNTRKRICKQCGLTFINIIDFVKHRKEHM